MELHSLNIKRELLVIAYAFTQFHLLHFTKSRFVIGQQTANTDFICKSDCSGLYLSRNHFVGFKEGQKTAPFCPVFGSILRLWAVELYDQMLFHEYPLSVQKNISMKGRKKGN